MDKPLVRSIAKGYAWLQEIKSSHEVTLSAIAEREGVKRKHIARLIDLAFLAPDIVEAMLSGSQPIDLSVDRLLKSTALDPTWATQRRQLGFRD
jgi:ParB-like chromosome segregation protein Spo0J